MNLVVGFLPFILFALLSRLSTDLALWIAFAASFVVTIRDFVESPSLRLLDAASLLLFALLALIRGFDPTLSLAAVRFLSELVLLIVLAASLILRRPFSLEYARLDPKEAGWPPALFLRVNYQVSSAWTAAFAVMAAADGAVAFTQSLPLYASIALSIAALAASVTFTLRYPAGIAKRATLPQAAPGDTVPPHSSDFGDSP
jgi:hypothetical protein